MPAPAPIVRRTLFTGELMTITHVAARPTSTAIDPLESQPCNVLVLPLAGVFAKHEGPRQHFIATANHAVLVAANRRYRVSFPGVIGDRCLTLRLSGETLARALPRAVVRDGFDLAAPRHRALARPAALHRDRPDGAGLHRDRTVAAGVVRRPGGHAGAVPRCARHRPDRPDRQ